MARVLNEQSIKILSRISQKPGITSKELFGELGGGKPYKDLYNNIYRLLEQELLENKLTETATGLILSNEGKRVLKRVKPERDGVWKLVIFDIPEKQKYVRVILRAKLKALQFKKWQNSIWISPFALDEEIEEELNELAKKYFVRLIKTTDINFTEDLEKMFEG